MNRATVSLPIADTCWSGFPCVNMTGAQLQLNKEGAMHMSVITALTGLIHVVTRRDVCLDRPKLTQWTVHSDLSMVPVGVDAICMQERQYFDVKPSGYRYDYSTADLCMET